MHLEIRIYPIFTEYELDPTHRAAPLLCNVNFQNFGLLRLSKPNLLGREEWNGIEKEFTGVGNQGSSSDLATFTCL